MEIDLEKLVKWKIPAEGYLILLCLYNNREDLITNYVTNVNKIPTHVFKLLIDEKYLTFMGNEELPVYTLDNLELTERFGKEVLGVSQKSNLTFDECFQQLREHYPLKTPSGRRLHHDLERSKRLYKAHIFKVGRVDDKLHSLILQCTNFIVKEKTKTNSLEYLKMLPTYLQQQEWTTVQEEVEKMIKNNQYVDKFSQSDSGGNLENKTILGSSDF